MKFSIITPTLNSAETIQDCIISVREQTYKDIEHIIVDGGSDDGTLERASSLLDDIVVIKGIDQGVFDAINKGIEKSCGDVVSFLGANDVLASKRVVESVACKFQEHACDAVYGDLLYMNKDLSWPIRHWVAGYYNLGSFAWGWSPPHPSFFLKKEYHDQYGLFRPDFQIAGDYELMLRMLMKEKIEAHYLPKVLVKMRIGGKSNNSLRSMFLKTREDFRAWHCLDRKPSFFTVFLKVVRKIRQFDVLFCPWKQVKIP